MAIPRIGLTSEHTKDGAAPSEGAGLKVVAAVASDKKKKKNARDKKKAKKGAGRSKGRKAPRKRAGSGRRCVPRFVVARMSGNTGTRIPKAADPCPALWAQTANHLKSRHGTGALPASHSMRN